MLSVSKQNDVPHSPLVLIILLLGIIAMIQVVRLPRCEKCGMFCSIEDRHGHPVYLCCGADDKIRP